RSPTQQEGKHKISGAGQENAEPPEATRRGGKAFRGQARPRIEVERHGEIDRDAFRPTPRAPGEGARIVDDGATAKALEPRGSPWIHAWARIRPKRLRVNTAEWRSR